MLTFLFCHPPAAGGVTIVSIQDIFGRDAGVGTPANILLVHRLDCPCVWPLNLFPTR